MVYKMYVISRISFETIEIKDAKEGKNDRRTKWCHYVENRRNDTGTYFMSSPWGRGTKVKERKVHNN